MTTCAGRSSAGARERVSYLKRCGCVMLACVLCFCLIQPPRAKAVAGVLFAAGASVSAAPIGAVIGVIILATVGVDFVQGLTGIGPEGGWCGTGAYEVGAACWKGMQLYGGEIAQWCEEVNARFEAKGGFDAKDELLIPAEVAEFARTWAKTQYDFSSGTVVINQAGIFSSTGQYLSATVTNTTISGYVKAVTLGTVIHAGESVTFPKGQTLTGTSKLEDSSSYPYLNSFEMAVDQSTNVLLRYFSSVSAALSTGFVFNIVDGDFVYGMYNDGLVSLAWGWKFPVEKLGNVVNSSATLTKTPELDKPQDDDIPVWVPDVPFGMIKDLRVPAIGSLTQDDVTTGEEVGPTTPPTTAPGEETDAKVGELELAKVKQQEKSLGALFISKFPFSIPWDFAAAVELLAAPPKVPHWEVDFFEPVAHRFGGWKGSTKIVIDFSQFELLGGLCRWVTTIMFCAALAGGTKRLLWTA